MACKVDHEPSRRACNDLPKSNNAPIVYYGGGGPAGVVPGTGFSSHSHL